MYAEQEMPMHVTACTVLAKGNESELLKLTGQRSDLCSDQQQCMVAQGVEGKEGGEVPSGHLLTHKLQSHATWPYVTEHSISESAY